MRSVKRLEYTLPLYGAFLSDGLVANPFVGPLLGGVGGVHGLEIDSMSMITALPGAERQAWHVDAPMPTSRGASASLRSLWRRRLHFCYGSSNLRGLAAMNTPPCTSCPCVHGRRVESAHQRKPEVGEEDARELQRRETRLLHAAMRHSRWGHFDDTPPSPPPGVVMAVPLVNLTGGAPPTQFIPGSHLECDAQLQATLGGEAPLGFYSRAEARWGLNHTDPALGEAQLADVQEVDSHGAAAVCPEAAVRHPWLADASAEDVVLFDLRTRHRGGGSPARSPTRPLVYAAFVQSWWRDSVNFPPPQSEQLGGWPGNRRRALRRLDSRSEAARHNVGTTVTQEAHAAVDGTGAFSPSPAGEEQSWATAQGYDAETLDDVVSPQAPGEDPGFSVRATLFHRRSAARSRALQAGSATAPDAAWRCALHTPPSGDACSAMNALQVDVVQQNGIFYSDEVLDSFMQQAEGQS